MARRWWGGELGVLGAVLDGLCAPVAWVFARMSGIRAERRAGKGSRIEGLAVVSVGNLAVGGTGKTPVAAWAAGRLLGAGMPTTVLTGAHGADEALLHERWTPCVRAVVASDRLTGATRAYAAGARALVLDDGFQNFALARDVDIVLLSADDPFPGSVLPRGPYREPPAALARADAIVVTRRAASEEEARTVAEKAARFAPHAATAGAWLVPSGLRPLRSWAGPGQGGTAELADARPAEPDGTTRLAPERAEGAGAFLAVCAIARPETFLRAVAGLVVGRVELLAFADHHAYTAADVARIAARADGRPIVTTEKDAVKLARHAARLGSTRVLVEELRWAWGEQPLAARLESLASRAVGR
jgi:tetraacyldisaccharide 4'-kinase